MPYGLEMLPCTEQHTHGLDCSPWCQPCFAYHDHAALPRNIMGMLIVTVVRGAVGSCTMRVYPRGHEWFIEPDSPWAARLVEMMNSPMPGLDLDVALGA